MSTAEFTALCRDFWEWRLREWPELASFCGDHRYDNRLNDLTADAFKRRKVEASAFLKSCGTVEASRLDDDSQRESLKLLTEELQGFCDGVDSRCYVFPLNNMEGIHIEFEQLTSWMKFETVADFKLYLARLEKLPQRLEQDTAMFQLGIDSGLTFSIQCVCDVPSQLDSLATKPTEETSFYAPFKDVSAELAGPDIEALRSQAVRVIDTEIRPALIKLKTFMKEVYEPACRPTPGLWSLSSGRDLYEHLLRFHTSPGLSPQQIHDIGKREVSNIGQEMAQILQRVGFQGDLKDFIQHLKTDDRFFCKDKDEVLTRFHDIADNQIRPKLSALFHKIPDSPLTVVTFPESKSSAPAAYYLAGTLDGARPGKFYINAHNLRNIPTYDMMTLALHEGEPGHHFQGMYAIGSDHLPLFRRYFEDMCYSLAPSRFGLHAAYGEGWGLYCEYLGKEMGLYEDPYSLFGHLSFEMFRACRLVADTGLHYFEWSFDQAVDLFLENTALSKEAIVNECKRYCAIPGQACSYKIGQIKIKELRQKASSALGAAFDVRDFHEEILRVGMVPLTVLEGVIDTYISRTEAGRQ